jgi:hypothetical protein
MARDWVSVRVELVEGRGDWVWPRPGRIFAAARRHTLADLASAIDDAFAVGTGRICTSSGSATADDSGSPTPRWMTTSRTSRSSP